MIVADVETLAARFRVIGGDWLAQKLTPCFAARAGTELVEPEGVSLAVDLALYDVSDGLPLPAAAAIRMHRTAIIEAMAAEPAQPRGDGG
jgi:hypothetical protein